MQINKTRDVFVLGAAMSLATSTFVSVVIMLLYPREEWLWELSLSLALTISLTMAISIYIGFKLKEIKDLSNELQRLVERDRLTNVATRDYFYARMEGASDAFGVSLMVDIDHFKRVNDTHGHMAGDAVIQRVAMALQNMVRPKDIVCRFGGEEFVVFLFGHTVAEAQEVAEDLRRQVAELVIDFEGQPLSVTVSIGGSLSARCADIDAAIAQADAALYRAKESGRNRTEFHASDFGDGFAPDVPMPVAS